MTIKDEQGRTLYPKTVTSLVYDTRTNRSLESILNDTDNAKFEPLIKLLKSIVTTKNDYLLSEFAERLNLENFYNNLSVEEATEERRREDNERHEEEIRTIYLKDRAVISSETPDKMTILTARINPSVQDFSLVRWTTDKPELVSLNPRQTECAVTAKGKNGTANVTCTYKDISKTCEVQITAYTDEPTPPTPPRNETRPNPQPITPPQPEPQPRPQPPEEPPYLSLSPTTFAVTKAEPTFVINADTHGKAKAGEINWYVSGGGNSTITPLDANRARVKVTDDGQIIVKAVYKGLEVFSYGNADGFAVPRPQEPTISLNPINARLSRERGQVEITATVTPELSGNDTIRWSIPSEDTILIGASGKTCRVTAKNNGTETITATYKGKEATATITVQGFNDIHFETRDNSVRGKNNITNRLIISPKNDDPNKQIVYTLEGQDTAEMSVSNNVVTLTPKKNGRGKVIAKYDDLTKAEFTFAFEGIEEDTATIRTSGRNLVTSNAQANGTVLSSGFMSGGTGKYSVALTLPPNHQYAITNLPTKKLADSINVALQRVVGRNKTLLNPSDYNNDTTMSVMKGDNTFTTRGLRTVTTDITKDNPLVFSTPQGARRGDKLVLYITSSIGEKDIFNEIKVEEVIQ